MSSNSSANIAAMDFWYLCCHFVIFWHHCGDVIVFVTGELNVLLGTINVEVRKRVFGPTTLHLVEHCSGIVSEGVFVGSIVLSV